MPDTKNLDDLNALRAVLTARRIEVALAVARHESGLHELILLHEAIVAVEAAIKDARATGRT